MKTKEEKAKYSKKYREENKDKIKELNKKWRLKNKEKIKLNKKIWSEKNKETIKLKGIKYRESNREALSKKNKEYYLNNYRKALGWNLARYGLTVDDFETMSKKQGDVCGICLNKCTSRKRLSVDHCHKTGIVRGLLCNKCNRALGLIGDNKEFLNNAIKYLER